MKGLSCNLKKILLTVSLLVLPCLLGLSSSFTQSASAIDLDYGSGGSYLFKRGYSWVMDENSTRYADRTVMWGGREGATFDITAGKRVRNAFLATDKVIPRGAIFTVFMLFQNYDQKVLSDTSVFGMVQPANNDIAVMDVKYIPNSSYRIQNYYNDDEYGWDVIDQLAGAEITMVAINDLVIIPFTLGDVPTTRLGSTRLTFFAGSWVKTVSSSQSQLDIKNEIIAGNNQAHEDSEKLLQATENQQKQDKEQYDQEKQEEQEREESGKEEGNKLLGIFNITLLNPFAGIWEIFNPGGCTSIPTIASWVHSEDPQYCSWWPQSIRATLTPVFSLASMMLLFGFVIRWLNGGSKEIVEVD